MKEVLLQFADKASAVLDSDNLITALRLFSEHLVKEFAADSSAILFTDDEPPLLVISTCRPLSTQCTSELRDHLLEVYERIGNVTLMSSPALAIHYLGSDTQPEVEELNDVIVSRLLAGPRLYGLIALGTCGTFQDELGETLHVVSRWIAVALKAVQQLRVTAHADPLTGLYTRRRIEEELEYLSAAGARSGHSVCLVIIDLDNFKAINELHGPILGDQVLREIAVLLRDLIRPTDILGRIAGDEFAIILPHTTGEEAFRLAHLWRAELCGHIYCDGRVRNGIHVSVGIADTKGKATAAHEIIAAADKAIYEAKKAGGNRVVFKPV